MTHNHMILQSPVLRHVLPDNAEGVGRGSMKARCAVAVLFAGALSWTGCDTTASSTDAVSSPAYTLIDVTRDLLDAPETVELDGETLAISAYLYRDFMPVASPDGSEGNYDGSPLMAMATVSTTSGAALPAGLRAPSLWVVQSGQAWFDDSPELESGAGQLLVGGRNGPKWGPDSFVDVVVELVSSTGVHVLLAARHCSIHKID